MLSEKDKYKIIEKGILEPLDFDIFRFKDFVNDFITKLYEPSDKAIKKEYKCKAKEQILPAYIRIGKIKEWQKEYMIKGIRIFNKISNIYQTLI